MDKTPEELKIDKARNMRYKKSVLESLSFEAIAYEIYEMMEVCADIHYALDGAELDTITESLDGNEEESYEFKMMFSDLEANLERLLESIQEYTEDDFDECTVGLLGRKQKVVGYDSYEEDYFSLGSYESELAIEESCKRLKRLTKDALITRIGQCMSIAVAFLDVRQQYDYLKATLDILKGENQALLQQLVQVDKLYQLAETTGFNPYEQVTKDYDALIKTIPDRFWVE